MSSPRKSLRIRRISISPSEIDYATQADIAELLDKYREDLNKAWFILHDLPQCSKILAPLVGKAEDSLAQAVYILKHHKQIFYEKDTKY